MQLSFNCDSRPPLAFRKATRVWNFFYRFECAARI